MYNLANIRILVKFSFEKFGRELDIYVYVTGHINLIVTCQQLQQKRGIDKTTHSWWEWVHAFDG